MVFPVVICICESWIVEQAEYQTIDSFELYDGGENSWESLGQQGDQTSQP